MTAHPPTSRAAFAASAAFAALLALAAPTLVSTVDSMYLARPGPQQEAGDDARSAFPSVDWTSWRASNRDMCAWITIPGTKIDYPVYAARSDDPDYYLHHSASGAWTIAGSIYLDSACSSLLAPNENSVLYGHNMLADGMFTELENMRDGKWAKRHSDVLVQTPEAMYRCKVVASEVVDARCAPKRTRFGSAREFGDWAVQTCENCSVVLGDAAGATSMLTLVVCSYTRFADERTVVHCIPVATYMN